MRAVRVGDTVQGKVSSHNRHIIGWTNDETPSPIYCSGHSVTGRQTTGASKTYIEGKKAARLGDSGTTNCPCDGRGYTVESGSGKVFIEGKAAARTKDRVDIHGAGKGSFNSSSRKVFVG